MRRFHILLCVFLFLQCLWYKPQAPGLYYEGTHQYVNSILGLKIPVTPEWNLYTSPGKAPQAFKKQFSHIQSQSQELLFVGSTVNERAYIRCITAADSEALPQYFQNLFNANKGNLTPIAAYFRQYPNGPVVEWSYSIAIKNIEFRFIDYLFSRNGFKFRLSFWTLGGLFDDYRKVFYDIAQSVCLSDTVGSTDCKPISSGIGDSVQSEVIEYATDKRELYFPDKQEPVCADTMHPFLWKASSPNSSLYLFGSIHVSKPEMYPLAKTVEDAFNASEYLVVEVNSTTKEFQEKAKSIAARAKYPPGETLKDHISPGVFQRLTAFLQKIGLPAEAVIQFKPWLAYTVISLFHMQSMGMSPQYGMEKYFLNKAEKGKPVLELETFEDQIALFENYLNNELFLSYALVDMSNTEKQMSKLVQAWKCGNVHIVEELTVKDLLNANPAFEPVINKMVFERNRTMASKVSGYLQEGKACFVVIGAAHLVGEKGIVALLRQAGYTVEQQ